MINRFNVLDDVAGEFWTRQDEMIKDLEDLGYEVLLANDEYFAIRAWDPECDDPFEFQLFLGHANSTIWVTEVREVA